MIDNATPLLNLLIFVRILSLITSSQGDLSLMEGESWDQQTDQIIPFDLPKIKLKETAVSGLMLHPPPLFPLKFLICFRI